MKTTFHHYRFDISDPAQSAAWDELRARLRAAGMRELVFTGMDVGPSESAQRSREMRKALSSLDGQQVELETKFLFSDQWNTAPIPGEMRETRRNTLKCGYCGAMEPAQKGYVFCPHCLDSVYLKMEDLALLRMVPVEDMHKTRAADRCRTRAPGPAFPRGADRRQHSARALRELDLLRSHGPALFRLA